MKFPVLKLTGKGPSLLNCISFRITSSLSHTLTSPPPMMGSAVVRHPCPPLFVTSTIHCVLVSPTKSPGTWGGRTWDPQAFHTQTLQVRGDMRSFTWGRENPGSINLVLKHIQISGARNLHPVSPRAPGTASYLNSGPDIMKSLLINL